ncbi:MAG TPA: YciI family protein [Burkholderiaceae bacterium]|nr:YciI family protein [Burkholderiaceae bacterium]
MRFMIIVKANADSEAGVMPSAALLAEMEAFHEELARAGVLLDGAGLRASALGWRVAIGADGQRRVLDGPFAETKELIAGFTLIQVRSREEALEWSRRFPNPTLNGSACEIEVRQLFEAEDFVPKA